MPSSYALTIWQPWASLIIAGAKPFEFRSWPAPAGMCGKRIAIHAGKRKPVIAEMRALRLQLHGENETGLNAEIAVPLLDRWILSPGALPVAHVLGTAVLGHPIRACYIPAFAGHFTNDLDRSEHANWGWPLSDIRPLTPPVEARGAQGFWRWTSEDHANG